MGRLYLNKLKESSSQRLEALNSELELAQEIIGKEGTIFATGSYGRLEAGPASDLDVFIVSLKKQVGDDPALNQVRQIRLKSELIVAVDKAGMAEFDSGGKFLQTHLFDDIVNEVGSPQDDYKNTFTGRMLLILESKPILGVEVYNRLKTESILSYFRDFEGNENEFVPFFLVNDLLRMWRTFCVNYEYFSSQANSDWRVKNLKLKYIRMLTCFSAVIYISAVYRLRSTVKPDDVERMSSLTPVERLEQFQPEKLFSDVRNATEIAEKASDLINDYGEFLEFVQEKNEAIRALKKDEEIWRKKSHEFSGKIARLIELAFGQEGFDNRLFRSILV